MSKKNVVKCNYADTPEPRVLNGLVCLRTAVPFTLAAGAEYCMSTQTKFDVPVLVVGHIREGVHVLNMSSVVLPGRQVTVTLRAEEDMLFERGDTVAVVLPVGQNCEFKLEP